MVNEIDGALGDCDSDSLLVKLSLSLSVDVHPPRSLPVGDSDGSLGDSEPDSVVERDGVPDDDRDRVWVRESDGDSESEKDSDSDFDQDHDGDVESLDEGVPSERLSDSDSETVEVGDGDPLLSDSVGSLNEPDSDSDSETVREMESVFVPSTGCTHDRAKRSKARPNAAVEHHRSGLEWGMM